MQRCDRLRNKIFNLGEFANVRKTNLLDNSAYLQFMWKADVVETWIVDKEAFVSTDDFGRYIWGKSGVLKAKSDFLHR